jgi:uncharacterized protein YkwD
VNRCLVLFIVLVSTLCLALPGAQGATSRHHGRANVHVRHERIHRAPRKGSNRSCRHPKAHKHGKHPGACKSAKRSTHHPHKLVADDSPPATVSSDCPNANLTPDAANSASVQAATVCLVNDERIRFGESALIENAQLASVADNHSRDMDARDYFSHISPTGETLLVRVQASGFIPNGNVGYTIGENIAWGTLWLATPNAIVKAWMESPGHRANILDAGFRYTGVGVDTNLPHSMSGGQAGGMYTQDFGTIIQ